MEWRMRKKEGSRKRVANITVSAISPTLVPIDTVLTNQGTHGR